MMGQILSIVGEHEIRFILKIEADKNIREEGKSCAGLRHSRLNFRINFLCTKIIHGLYAGLPDFVTCDYSLAEGIHGEEILWMNSSENIASSWDNHFSTLLHGFVRQGEKLHRWK